MLAKFTLRKITNRNLLLFLGLAASAAVLSAYAAQYIFGFEPCNLCYYQRKPFFVVIAAVALTLTYFKSEKSKQIALYVCTFALIANLAIAFYHSGVEKKIFILPETCTASEEINQAETIEDLQQSLAAAKTVRCDEPNFFFLGLTMANWNVLYCLGLISCIAFVRYKRRCIKS